MSDNTPFHRRFTETVATLELSVLVLSELLEQSEETVTLWLTEKDVCNSLSKIQKRGVTSILACYRTNSRKPKAPVEKREHVKKYNREYYHRKKLEKADSSES